MMVSAPRQAQIRLPARTFSSTSCSSLCLPARRSSCSSERKKYIYIYIYISKEGNPETQS